MGSIDVYKAQIYELESIILKMNDEIQTLRSRNIQLEQAKESLEEDLAETKGTIRTLQKQVIYI